MLMTEEIALIERHETEGGTNYHRFYIDVTGEARELFGDIVVSARQMVYEREIGYDWCVLNPERHEELAQMAAQRITDMRGSKGGIAVNAGFRLFVLFTSGKTICFHTSEWGGICVARKNMATS